ncbi:MarR family winged helix-turn-helix transcriptional regulator [Halopiger djelfimassiliensis]|uniref:MarR family winged helix-turn-helix transcriptional regulator n=1 Tax=Halopiger djelfimassiliensis TaxID=1293047 RepID=UPI000677A290|nr:MarR family winged helix-turn-helix transcriptional regulator [Halopiger djelfimassiliensis]
MSYGVQPREQTWGQNASQLREYPPSAKLVAKVLTVHGEMTQRDLVEETMLPARTVRHAVNTLEDDDHLESRHCWTDARKRLYRLTLEDREPNR